MLFVDGRETRDIFCVNALLLHKNSCSCSVIMTYFSKSVSKFINTVAHNNARFQKLWPRLKHKTQDTSVSQHSVWSVITAHNLTPDKCEVMTVSTDRTCGYV